LVRFSKTIGLLLAAALCNAANGETVGDWEYKTQGVFYAATTNDSGNLFGQWCDIADRSCMYLMAIPVNCVTDERYLLLSNSDSSANGVEILCRGSLGSKNADGRPLYRYVFTNFDSIDHQVRHSRRIGFAFPMAGDAFHVARFSLAGAVPAITAMRGAAERRVPATPQGGGTRDLRL
jgi:hypothetical protein